MTTASRQQDRDLGALARGGALNLLGSATQALFGFGLVVVLGRGLGAEAVGAFLEAIAVFMIVAVAATMGIDTGLVRSVSRWRAGGRRGSLTATYWVAFVPVAVVAVGASVGVLAGADWLAEVFGAGESVEGIAALLRVMALAVPAYALALGCLGATRGWETMVPSVVVDRVGRPAAQFVFVLVGVLAGVGASTLAVAWSLPVWGACLATAWTLRRMDRRSRRPLVDVDDPGVGRRTTIRHTVRDFWAFTLPRSFASIFRVVVLWLDVLLVGALMSPRAAGIYAVSTRLLQFGLAVALAVGQVSQPMISRLLATGARDETRSVYSTATSWQMLLTWPQYLALAVFAPAVLGLFGQEFVAGAGVVAILAGSAMVGSAAGPVDMVLLMAGRSMWSLWNTALALGVNVGLNLWLIPTLGIEGAALAWAASRIVGNLVPLVQVSWSLGLHPFGRPWVQAAASTVACFGIVGLGVRWLVGPTMTGAITYAVLAMGLTGFWWWLERDVLELPVALSSLRRRFAGGQSSA